MTYQNTPQSDPSVRPDRIRFLAEIPIETYHAISHELMHQPDWDRFFIMKNPVAWPDGMFEAIERHTSVSLQ